jgi:hypothetical protein
MYDNFFHLRKEHAKTAGYSLMSGITFNGFGAKFV